MIDASGAQRVHLVGYDFGSGVAWAFAAEMPERLASLVTMSVPHPAAFLKALATSRQAFASWCMCFFQLPESPERVLLRRRGTETVMSKMLQSDKQTPEAANRDARAMAEPGVLTAMLNWYRAIPLSGVRGVRHKITVPTMYVWRTTVTPLCLRRAHESAGVTSAANTDSRPCTGRIGCSTSDPTRSQTCCSNGSPPIRFEPNLRWLQMVMSPNAASIRSGWRVPGAV